MTANNLQSWVDRFSDRKAGHLSQPATQIFLRNTMRGIKMKTCTKCHQEKDLTEFYKDQGSHSSKSRYKPHCKTCQRRQRKIYLQSEIGMVITKAYSKSETSKARHMRYCERHPERRKAKGAVYYAIQAGKLCRPNTLVCFYTKCLNQAEEYHHWSYRREYWLDVKPLCIKHHKHIHDNPDLLEKPTDNQDGEE